MHRLRHFPGGLRTQLLLGLMLMLLATFALVLVTVENLLARQISSSALEEVDAVAETTRRALDQGVAPEQVVDGSLVAVGIEESGGLRCVGRACSSLEASVDRRLVRGDDGNYLGIAAVDGVAIAWSLPQLRQRQDAARAFLFPFFIVGAVFVLALGYGFFTFLIMRPLRAIGVAANRASDGDFASPITLLPRNEFGEVGRSFNRMLERIDEGRTALETQIEEVRRTNERLASTQASLVRSEKLASVGQLAAGIAHEVGNPLAAVSGYVDLMETAQLDEAERDEILERIGKQLERMRTIIRNLLDYSRKDDELAPVTLDLGDVVADSLALVEAIPRARNKSFEVSGTATARGVSGHLVQVLVNLLVNAVDAYGDAEGTIRLRLEEESDRARMTVEDEGPGIPAAELERIFDPFFTTKDPGEGTGLGLSICQRLVEDLDGELNVTSVPDEGTTFTITLEREV